jgi:glutathione synthase/RimK-type ligase-like ATP-grasp enzyme
LEKHKDRVLLAKPSKGKGGEGIFFIKSRKDISRDTMRAFEYVAQEYVSNPLLIENK